MIRVLTPSLSETRLAIDAAAEIEVSCMVGVGHRGSEFDTSTNDMVDFTSAVIRCVDDCIAGEIEGRSLRDDERIWIKGQET
jgi:hypothetical protein